MCGPLRPSLSVVCMCVFVYNYVCVCVYVPVCVWLCVCACVSGCVYVVCILYVRLVPAQQLVCINQQLSYFLGIILLSLHIPLYGRKSCVVYKCFVLVYSMVCGVGGEWWGVVGGDM